MGTVISAVDARRTLGHLLNLVQLKNEDVIIERAGKKIARITSVDSNSGGGEGKLDFRQARGLGKEVWRGVNVAEYIAGERGQWD